MYEFQKYNGGTVPFIREIAIERQLHEGRQLIGDIFLGQCCRVIYSPELYQRPIDLQFHYLDKLPFFLRATEGKNLY